MPNWYWLFVIWPISFPSMCIVILWCGVHQTIRLSCNHVSLHSAFFYCGKCTLHNYISSNYRKSAQGTLFISKRSSWNHYVFILLASIVTVYTPFAERFRKIFTNDYGTKEEIHKMQLVNTMLQRKTSGQSCDKSLYINR